MSAKLEQATELHPNARVILAAAAKTGEASHAYLFHGPCGVGKADAARAFAAELLALGAPDPDSARDRALRNVHPCLTWVSPSGAHQILKEDIIPVVRSAAMTPMEGTRQVFVIESVELFHEGAANRMLKTIEEPIPGTHFILLTSRPDQTMPTIVSRCQQVRFDAIPTESIAEILTTEGVDPARAKSCAALSGGDVHLARELASDDGDQLRSEANRIIGCALVGASGRERPWEPVLARATEAGELAEQRRLAKLETDLEAFPKGREKAAAQKEGEQSATRIARRVRSDSLDRSLRISALLLRDLAVSAAGADDLVLAQDRAPTITKTASGRKIGPLLEAAEEVEGTRQQLGRNVAEELTLQALSFRLDRLLAGV